MSLIARAPRSTRVPAEVAQTLTRPGTPLDARTRATMEPRLGHDLGQVRVHEDAAASRSARSIDALAYTAGDHVVLGAAFSSRSVARTRLLAHELAHVVQQRAASSDPGPLMLARDGGRSESEADHVALGRLTTLTGTERVLARAPTSIGTKFTHPAGATTTLTRVHATFDGADFTVFDGKKAILTHAAQSGRPVTVRATDASACKGAAGDSYLNNPLYVGIKDFGPIPEGEYSFSLSAFATFTGLEQLRMISGGSFTDPFGTALHGGDWGSGRAPLTPLRILPGPPGCGRTTARSGFYLHGGSLPGSSGCIDIDNDGIDKLLTQLTGYRSSIPVKVRYTAAAPTVPGSTRTLGGFTYPTDEKGQPIKDPSVWDRLKSATKD